MMADVLMCFINTVKPALCSDKGVFCLLFHQLDSFFRLSGRLPETAFIPDHNDIVNVPIHITLAMAVELDFILTIDIHPQTILSIEVEWTIGAVPVVPGAFEIDAQETLCKVDSGIDVFR